MNLPSHPRSRSRLVFHQPARLAILGLLLSTYSVFSAPLTVKELEFLVRQGTSEAEIVRQAKSRRLMAPLDTAAIDSLKKNGATNSLIAKLNDPGIALDAAAAAAEARRQAVTKARVDAVLAEEAARRAMRDRQWNQTAERLRESRMVQGWLHEKLYKLQRFDLKPVEPKSIESVSVFAFFHGSMGSAPSRDFAPQLAEAYTRLKEHYGNDFEVIFISHDRDEFNQKEFMRTFRLTCPTMKLGSQDESIMQFMGDREPWFVLVAENGKPLSLNGVNRQFIEPFQVLQGLEQLLAALHR
jgi:hypothetical protein